MSAKTITSNNAVTATGISSNSNNIKSQNRKYDVIIIGAGLSGKL